MNSMQVKEKLKNTAKNKNVDFNTMLKFYVFDRFVVRLSKSKFKNNFILKGGFLLSSLFGLENRSTMDIDSLISGQNFTINNISDIVESIINVDIDDNVKFFINGITRIREEDQYGGFRVNLMFEFENIKEILKLDITTGDLITPSAIEYKYRTILTDEYIKVLTYNVETMLAEKIETIFSKLELSSRMKDYYDIYLIYNKNWDRINKNNLIKAMKNTFNKRNFNSDLNKSFDILKESSIMKKRWYLYSKKYNYCKDIEYEDIMICLEEIIGVFMSISV